jgi:hypothetical protein
MNRNMRESAIKLCFEGGFSSGDNFHECSRVFCAGFLCLTVFMVRESCVKACDCLLFVVSQTKAKF